MADPSILEAAVDQRLLPSDVEHTPFNPEEAATDSQALLLRERRKRRRKGRFIFLISLAVILALLLAILLLISIPLYFRGHRYASQPRLFNGTDYFLPTVVMVSIDGFRADYLDRYSPNYLTKLALDGVRADWMYPSFPSSTFPNHYTLVTGLVPSHHGIIANSFYSPVHNQTFNYKSPSQSHPGFWWDGGNPIWNVMVEQGGTSAVHMWPGSQSVIRGHKPTVVDDFEPDWEMTRKAERVLGWIDGRRDYSSGEIVSRMGLMCVYIDTVDHVGHAQGPNGTDMMEAVNSVDRGFFGALLRGLEDRNLTNIVNVVVVSDHGMADVTEWVYVDDMLDLEHEVDADVHGLPLGLLWPKPGISIDSLYSRLKKYAFKNKKRSWDVFKREEIPEAYQYRDNPSIPPLVLLPQVV